MCQAPSRITSYNVCYTKLLRGFIAYYGFIPWKQGIVHIHKKHFDMIAFNELRCYLIYCFKLRLYSNHYFPLYYAVFLYGRRYPYIHVLIDLLHLSLAGEGVITSYSIHYTKLYD